MDAIPSTLNRFLYKTPPDVGSKDNTVVMQTQNNSAKDAAQKNSTAQLKKEANQIITGTVITACLIKSSDQDDRIEMGQNLQSILDPTKTVFPFVKAGSVDYLAGYFHGLPTILFTGEGIVYFNFVQQGQKWINLENNLVYQNLSDPEWSVSHLGTGRYRVTHNIGHTFYSCNAQVVLVGLASPYMCMISDKDENSFTINTYNSGGSHVDIEWNCMVDINPS